MWIKVIDEDDGCTYTLDITVKDALQIYNLQNLNKSHIDLPSIGGNATISNGNVIVMYKNGGTGHG